MALAGKNRHAANVKELWHKLNLTDRLYGALYLIVGVAVCLVPSRVPNWNRLVLLHTLVIGFIAIVAENRDRNRAWRFAHDWYPIFVFIFIFEEIARLSLVFIPTWQDAHILRFEAAIFAQPPTIWLNQWQSVLLIELLEFGYFTFYWILPAVGGVLYADTWNADTAQSRDSRLPYRMWMDATAAGYMACYALFLLFPTEGPAHTLPIAHSQDGGPFRWLVLLIQHNGGVHGNAFPSGHIMASTVALLAALRWSPKFGKWLIVPVLLMAIGAVYDNYHYLSDVVAGTFIGIIAFFLLLALRRTRPHLVS